MKGHQPEKMSLEPCLKLTVADGWEQIPDNWSCDEESTSSVAYSCMATMINPELTL